MTFSDELSGSNSPSTDTPAANRTVWGDLLCLGSASLYASYVIVLRRALPDDDEADVALFFGYVGLFCTVLFGPVVAGFAMGGVMSMAGVTKEALGLILVQGGRCAGT